MRDIRIINQNIDNGYIDLFYHLYKKEKNIDYFISDVKLSIDYCLSMKDMVTVTLSGGGVLLGHCSIIKPRGNDNGDTAYFGFFESPANQKDFFTLWKKVVSEAKKQNIKKLIGPINGSIWFPYRTLNTSDGSPLFKGELPNDYYHKHFYSLKNKRVINYSSGMREKFDGVMKLTKKPYELLKGSDLEIQSLSQVSEKILREIHKLAMEIFSSKSVAYEDFPSNYFLKLYDKERMNNLFGTYIVKKGEKLIGFCNVFYEEEKIIILKTLAIHPLFQKQGIGSAMAYLVHYDAKERGIEKIIYALVRDGNDIKFFPRDDVVDIRTYSLFEIDI